MGQKQAVFLMALMTIFSVGMAHVLVSKYEACYASACPPGMRPTLVMRSGCICVARPISRGK